MTAVYDDEIADLQRANAALRRELEEQRAERDAALAREAALAEVLDLISRSTSDPGNVVRVFEAILDRAMQLCAAAFGAMFTYDGGEFQTVALRGVSAEYAEYQTKHPPQPSPGTPLARMLATRKAIHTRDLLDDPGHQAGDPRGRYLAELGGARTAVAVPLLKADVVIGFITIYRKEVHAFSDEQIALLENFAAQAAITVENMRLLTELQQRNTEFGERIEQLAATIAVLKAMSASPGDPQPVLELIVRNVRDLCECTAVALLEYDGARVHLRALLGAESYGPVTPETYASLWPMPPVRGSLVGRAILDRRTIHTRDVAAEGELDDRTRSLGHGSNLVVPFMRDGQAIGALTMNSREPGGFSDSQVALLQTFAEQAVIAITGAETYRALQERTSELQQSLEYQTATNDVLKIISRSSFDLEPVFQVVVDTATRLCRADQAAIYRLRDGAYRWVGSCSNTPEYECIEREVVILPGAGTLVGRVARDGCAVEIPDAWTDPLYEPKDDARVGGIHTLLGVPLMRDGEVIGVIGLARRRIEPYTEAQIGLVSTFANQAVIAIENTRLLTEQREALEQQTATAEVLQVINSNPGNLEPVFDALLEKALHLCQSEFGRLWRYDDPTMYLVAERSLLAEANLLQSAASLGAPWVPEPGSAMEEVVHGADVVHIADLTDTDAYRSRIPRRVQFIEQMGARTALWVSLRKDAALLGVLVIYRREVRLFTDKQIALLQNFAAQAVIAMENARLLDEIRRRQDELRITFENMGDGVAMFDETPRLVAWNRKFQEILDVPDGILAERRTYDEYIRYLTERGEFGPNADPEAQIRRLQVIRSQTTVFERARPDGRVIEVRHNPVPGGGFVLIYADITERKRSEVELRAARDAAEEANRTLQAAYRDLKAAQANLIQAEKMASLGQLTAGIAHEIKNPLNFVNNFASLSVELLAELKETAAPGFAALPEERRADVEEVSGLLTSNLQKIVEHGKRADGIVKSMLEHSRGASGERRSADVNTLVDEALNLAYHGARAQDQSFSVALERDFGAGIAPIELAPQEMTRVFLNLFSNGFYATRKRAQSMGDTTDFESTVKVTTRDLGDVVEVRIRDNGTGIAAEVKDKLFQPFFTTKPTGEGTGLGLSISYDIVTRQHGGTIAVESEPGAFTEFTITLPRLPAAVGERVLA